MLFLDPDKSLKIPELIKGQFCTQSPNRVSAAALVFGENSLR